ncbi:MAG TPA: hypothetical protein VF221_14665 [Chloroflexota bacterium]
MRPQTLRVVSFFAPLGCTHTKETTTIFRRSRQRARLALLSALLLSTVIAPLGAGTVGAAAGPKVSVKCTPAVNGKTVSCWTWGSSFLSGERVALTYRIVYITQPRVNAKRPQRLLHAAAQTNANDSFVKPAVVTFSVSRLHNSFALYVKATGLQKDKGTTSLASISK